LRTSAIVAVVAVLAAGCGGSKPLTHESFTAKANALCARYRAQIVSIRRPGLLTAFQAYLGRVRPVLRTQRAELAKLKPPNSDDASVRRLLAGWDGVLAALDEMDRGARTGDDAPIAFGLKRANHSDIDARHEAATLALPACRRFDPFLR